MNKKIKILIFQFSFIFILMFSAFGQETVTITTYYPAPYGVYNQFVTQTLGVGDNNNDGSLNGSDAPDPSNAAQAGNVWIKGRVGIGTAALPNTGSAELEINDTLRFTPTTSPDSAVEGAMYYDSSAKALKYYHSSTWKNLGGSLGSSTTVNGSFIQDNPDSRSMFYRICNSATPQDTYIASLGGGTPATFIGAQTSCAANSVMTGMNIRVQDGTYGCGDRPDIQYIDLTCAALSN